LSGKQRFEEILKKIRSDMKFTRSFIFGALDEKSKRTYIMTNEKQLTQTIKRVKNSLYPRPVSEQQ